VFAAFLLLTLSVQAAPFCGSLDVGAMDNNDLESFIFLNDVAKEKSPARGQCGLPGEKLAVCSSCSVKSSETMMATLRPILADEQHAAWHSGWHSARRAPPTTEEFGRLQSSGWVSLRETHANFSNRHTGQGDLAGEDFFYMHRTMIKMVQMELAAAGHPCIAPWKKIPSSIHDNFWPVPKEFGTAAEEAQARTELQELQSRLDKLRDPARLKKVSLNKYGLAIEAGIHQQLHNFYRGNPVCSPEAKAQGFCDDLLSPETSAVNKYFWKIHGLVDQMLGDWLKANGYEEIARDCTGKRNCYQWQGTWYGKAPRPQ
jgi:hypothetical protein